MKRVAVSILNYNSSDNTVACVQSLLRSDFVQATDCYLDIVVADNGSVASDRIRLSESLAETSNVQLVTNATNFGFAAGHNRNLEAILSESSPDYVWLLNNDCLVAEDCLSLLIQSAARNPDVGIWGATILESDGQTIQCAGGCFYNSWTSSYRQYAHGRALTEVGQFQVVDLDYIAGATLFFTFEALQCGLSPPPETRGEAGPIRSKWLNENFFLYFEELDLAQRLKPGLKMAWCKAAMITHAGGVSTGASSGKKSELAEYHSSLSALKFTRTYYPRRLWMMAPVRYMLKCLQLIINGKPGLLKPLTRAYRDFWFR